MKKVYEELLIGDNTQVTSHPKIKKIDEPYISFDELEKYLIDLNNLLNKNQTNEVKDLLQKLILYILQILVLLIMYMLSSNLKNYNLS